MAHNTSWADLNTDGRRIEKLILICNANIEYEVKKAADNHEPQDDARIWGYMDRIVKLTTNKKEIADMVLGVNKILRTAKKASLLHV